MTIKIVVPIQSGGVSIFGHDAVREQNITDMCPRADKKKGIPGGAFMVPVTLLQVAKARVGRTVDLGIHKCTLCGAKRHFVMARKFDGSSLGESAAKYATLR